MNSFQITPWVLASRPKTLTAGFIPVLAATALALADRGNVDWLLVICALFTSFFIQIGTNLTNDALDFKKGRNGSADRLGPLRMTQSGMLSMHHVMQEASFALLLLAYLGCPWSITEACPWLLLWSCRLCLATSIPEGRFPLVYYRISRRSICHEYFMALLQPYRSITF